MKEEWQQYLRCDGLPDPRVVTQAATYLHVWREQQQWGGEELARRCEETLPMLEMLETFVANARHYSPQQAENYNEIRLALREQLHHTIQHVSYMLLRDLETNLTAHSIKLATYEKEFKGLQLNFWVAIRMPTRKPKPVETEPEPIELSFPPMKVTVTLPKVVDASCACVRAAKYMLDLLSESSRTYRLAEEPEDWYEDLYSFNVREHEAVTALSSEQEATRKDFFKAVKARVKELEGLIKANIYVRNKAAEEELEELSLKEPQGLGDPRAFIVQQNELEFADYLKRCNYRTRRGEINLRKYRICGGIIQIDLLETPPQPKRMRDDIDITTCKSSSSS
ncbi:hypothetical protein JYU34_021955 [Plutella xylostella]|uniref:IC97/Casc1 N-terminal domain-containing protein n=1 Tax=Plutella xylostella TaxID=51655 RepID=A0ABQ7PRR3_PLUXY|nr:hypothetical protein JYU34_021955 [Plutella xylostella]